MDGEGKRVQAARPTAAVGRSRAEEPAGRATRAGTHTHGARRSRILAGEAGSGRRVEGGGARGSPWTAMRGGVAGGRRESWRRRLPRIWTSSSRIRGRGEKVRRSPRWSGAERSGVEERQAARAASPDPGNRPADLQRAVRAILGGSHGRWSSSSPAATILVGRTISGGLLQRRRGERKGGRVTVAGGGGRPRVARAGRRESPPNEKSQDQNVEI